MLIRFQNKESATYTKKEVLARTLVALSLILFAFSGLAAGGGADTDLSVPYKGPHYDPVDFTLAVSGPDISPEEMAESSNALLNNFTALFKTSVAPVALSDSVLSPQSFAQRKNLSGCEMSAPTVSGGYTGTPVGEVPDGTKLAAYGFRVLPTEQTTAYGYVVSADAKDTEYAAAGEDLNEWLNATDEKMKAAGASLVACAAEGTAPSEPKLIGELYLNYFYRSAATDEGMYGRLEFTSAWYWDTQEESEAREHFFTTSQIKMTPGTYLSRNMYKNLHFLLTIDPDYSLGEVTSLPGVYTDDEQPHGTGDTTQAACSVSISGTGLSWTTDMPDGSLVFGRPAGQISVWEGRGKSTGIHADKMLVFQAGEEITGQAVRTGTRYLLSRNAVDMYRAFGYIDEWVHPLHVFYVPKCHDVFAEKLYIQWSGES